MKAPIDTDLLGAGRFARLLERGSGLPTRENGILEDLVKRYD